MSIAISQFRNFAIAATLLLAVTIPVSAQGAMRGPGRDGPRAHPVETALRLKDELKLNANQVSQLEALREEIVAQQQASAQKMIDVRSRLAAGLVKREDVRKEFEGNRDALREVIKQRHERFEKILTEEQRTQLREKTRARMMHHRKDRIDRRDRMDRRDRTDRRPGRGSYFRFED